MVVNPQQLIESFTQPPAGLFDRIILAIKLEKEFKQTKKLLAIFTTLLIISVVSMPFSFLYLVNRWQSSGISYFISVVMENWNMLFVLWQDFLLSVLESLPLMGLFLFSLNVALLVFTVRLFLYKKGLLLKYIKHNFV